MLIKTSLPYYFLNMLSGFIMIEQD